MALSPVDLRAIENKQLNGQPTEAKTASEQVGKTEDIPPLIKQLDHDEFKQRESAEKGLRELGVIAIPALVQVVNSKSPEASVRAFNIIAHHFKSGEDEARETAAEVLQKLKESGESFSARAKQVIEAKENTPRVGNRFNLQVAGNAGLQRRVAVTVKNGIKQVDAKEGGRQVKIVDDPQKGITVEVTEEENGKRETKKFAAGNIDELKEKNPEAHRLYEKYVGNVRANGGNIRIQIKSNTP
ncbi:MAG: hypothetical protein GY899_02030 [Verrucomicrobiaceae bacterium]|nr:hypothetical protein [Verrucomicrobiaceae bacterium]